ncbi:hypothetical protein SGL43_02368 [Streptomyces globisporus]|uniref:Uncharacterized protein n=1 Tax=Streptomyces globisporus TaxID=1908 RepID=A0ABM9GXS3_STRGL|nr:hypothetical protein SGL43_02368 [Streptomyces globisporus]
MAHGSAPMHRCRKVAASRGWVSRVEDDSVAEGCPGRHGRGLGRPFRRKVNGGTPGRVRCRRMPPLLISPLCTF